MLDIFRSQRMRWGRLVFILLCLSALASLTWLEAPVMPGGLAAELQPVSLAGHQRLLILAPHCDDETLGSAGLILAAQRLGMQVQVVIATNGDGYFFATAQDFGKLYPKSTDYVLMGALRQQESLAALKILGVPAQQVAFLSYPDRGTPAEWNTYWSAQTPYRSPYSQDTRSPYPLTYNPKSVYAGQDYLADLISIMQSYQPDLIVYPNPDDVHPDHWGLNVFVRLAIAELAHADATFQPTQLTYLVHRPGFPTVRGYKPQMGLVPPRALVALYPDWFRLELTPADEQSKAQAVQAYRSQLPLLRGLMESFVRTNELFAPVETASLPLVAAGNPLNPSSWIDANGQPIQPVERDPVGDFFVRRAIPGADLVAVYLARDQAENLWMCSQARDEISAGLTYRLRIKALNGSEVQTFEANSNLEAGWKKATHSGVYTCVQVSLAALGHPWAVFTGSDVEGGGRLIDQTGWQLVTIPSAP